MTTEVDINQTVADLQTYAKSVDYPVHFALVVKSGWSTPFLFKVPTNEDLESILRRFLNNADIPFSEVSAYEDGYSIYEKTLGSPPKKPQYKQITLDDVVYNLVPAE